MKRALILMVALGLFGTTLLQAGHRRHCCCQMVSSQSVAVAPVATGASAMPTPQTGVAASNGTTYRSYSYEPAANTSNFTYTTQSTQYRSARRPTPSYMLPKTDPRKFGSGF
ncbi:MAG: hypothetical protein KDA68_20620 [Planctomycetaceae bacterium]|nr:hypothetical protein [Planctomycetaceae bacterium]